MKDLPGSQNGKWAKMCEDGKVGVYLVALDTDTAEIEKNNFLSEKNGYIGKSQDVIMRSSCIKATVNSKANCVYHNAGLYIRNRLDKIPLDRYVVKYFYTDEDQVGDFEAAFHAAMTDKFGYTNRRVKIVYDLKVVPFAGVSGLPGIWISTRMVALT